MIAIFSLLGLVLFGGGLYAIYDGWPYLVLERGFTEVIIGSIAATGGLIMLSLAWVLKQLKAIRAELVEAAEARASMPAPADAVMPVIPRDGKAAGEPSVPAPVAPAVLGAGAAGLGAAAGAAAVADKPEAAASDAETPDRDLFGALVADDLAGPVAVEEPREEPPEPARDEAVPDMFEEETVAVETAGADQPVIDEEQSREPTGTAPIQPPPSDEEALRKDVARDDEETEATTEAEADEERSGHSDAATEGRKPAEQEAERDEFAALRESLTSQLDSLHRPAGRIEPSLASEEDPFAEAEAWIRPPDERREPSFDTPLPAAEKRAEPPVPVWPPRTEPPHGPAAAASHASETPPEIAPEEAGIAHAAEDAVPVNDAEPDGSEGESPEKEAAPAAPEPAPAPAASDEGIVGAYQVGETHFTIYADGSIRARTPDGEYSFASMDELKVYLASEKSRLGV